jgi:hypothetical protein
MINKAGPAYAMTIAGATADPGLRLTYHQTPNSDRSRRRLPCDHVRNGVSGGT